MTAAMSAPTTGSLPENVVSSKPAITSTKSLKDEPCRPGSNSMHSSSPVLTSTNSGSSNSRRVELCNPEELYAQLVREEQNKEKERSQRRAKALEYYANLERSAVTIQREFRRWRRRRILREQALAAAAVASRQRVEAEAAAAERQAAARDAVVAKTKTSKKAKSVFRLITFWKTRKLIPPPASEDACSSGSGNFPVPATSLSGTTPRPLGQAFSLPVLQSPPGPPPSLPRYVSDNHRTAISHNSRNPPDQAVCHSSDGSGYPRPRSNTAPPAAPSMLLRQSVPGVVEVLPAMALVPLVINHTSAPVKASELAPEHPPPTTCLSNPDSSIVGTSDESGQLSSTRGASQSTTAGSSNNTGHYDLAPALQPPMAASLPAAPEPFYAAPQAAGKTKRLALVWEEISFTRRPTGQAAAPERPAGTGMTVRSVDGPSSLAGLHNSSNSTGGDRQDITSVRE